MLSYATLLLAAIAQFACASPIDHPVRRGLAGWGYATFYDDGACTANPTVAFGMGNSGCIANQGGKNSIYVQPGFNSVLDTVSLVWSPGSSCNCQNDCASVANNGNDDYCWNLNGHAAADSFRFITQKCSANNC